MHFPRNDLPGFKQVKKLFVVRVSHKVLEGIEPDFDPSLNRQILPDTRNDNLATIIKRHILKFGVLREKDQFLSC